MIITAIRIVGMAWALVLTRSAKLTLWVMRGAISGFMRTWMITVAERSAAIISPGRMPPMMSTAEQNWTKGQRKMLPL